MILRFVFLALSSLVLLHGCSTTPVSGRQALILVPFSQEMALGAQAYQEVLTKEKPSANAELNAIVQRVGKRIAAASDMPDLPWEFTLIESNQMNAFALPGGKTAIYTAMLPVCANEAGLAAVMGHEIAHVIARHGAQRMSQDMIVGLGMTAASISLANNEQQGLILGALGLGTTLGVTLPFSRGMESEADEIGLIYMAKAGYDPAEAQRFWTRFAQMKQGPQPAEFLSTHPADGTRIRQIQQMMPRALSAYQRNPNKYGLGESFLVANSREKIPELKTPSSQPTITPGSIETLKPLQRTTPKPGPQSSLNPGPAMYLDNKH